MKDLSGKTGAIVEDTKAVQDYRLHPINRDKSPVEIEDLKSVPEVLRNAAEDDFFGNSNCRKEREGLSAFSMKR